jgi:hypothetical protein
MSSRLTFDFYLLTVLMPSVPMISPVMPTFSSANADANANHHDIGGKDTQLPPPRWYRAETEGRNRLICII